MPLSIDQFVELHPKLYHMAESRSWDSIQQHGLLSTQALLDLYDVDDDQRRTILESHRPECVEIFHCDYGSAVIRDQKPMSDRALTKCLQDGLTPSDWYKILNSKTFFWTTKERLLRLLAARAYRGTDHCVLTVDTAEMFDRHSANITLSPYNSGSTIMNPVPRGNNTFLPLERFPYEHWLSRGRRKTGAFVELVVNYSVPDLAEFTDRAEIMHENIVTDVIYIK